MSSTGEGGRPPTAHDSPVLSLVFKGNARDYFRLWIVNLCLTLFTLGIFSAWAKVRTKRYFYTHTELEGVPFEYLANPIPILKGRLLGALLLFVWYAGTHVSYTLLLVALGLGVVLAPWVMVRSAAFNARYSSYRNLTFHFAGNYRSAAAILFASALLVACTLGVGWPWAVARVRRYMVQNTSFGGVTARYTALGGNLLLPFLALGGALFGASLFGVLALSGRSSSVTLATVGTYVVSGFGYAYLQARLGRINWAHSSLGPIGFRADFRARDFVWIYFSNAVAIIGSLGFMIPWASVRMFRYRIEKLSVKQFGPFDGFVGRKSATVTATGAEVADLFDFDLSL